MTSSAPYQWFQVDAVDALLVTAHPRRWAKGTRPGDTGRRLWHAGSNGRWTCGVVVAPEIDFAVLVACNCGWLGIAAWKTRQALKALIRTFAPKRTS